MSAKWHASRYGKGFTSGLPEIPGVYVVADVTRLGGFPVEIKPLYVGQSTNLRRRTMQHLDRLEPNPELNGAAERQHALELWWRAADPADLDEVEQELIVALQPPANRQYRRRGSKPVPRDDRCK